MPLVLMASLKRVFWRKPGRQDFPCCQALLLIVRYAFHESCLVTKIYQMPMITLRMFNDSEYYFYDR